VRRAGADGDGGVERQQPPPVRVPGAAVPGLRRPHRHDPSEAGDGGVHVDLEAEMCGIEMLTWRRKCLALRCWLKDGNVWHWDARIYIYIYRYGQLPHKPAHNTHNIYGQLGHKQVRLRDVCWCTYLHIYVMLVCICYITLKYMHGQPPSCASRSDCEMHVLRCM